MRGVVPGVLIALAIVAGQPVSATVAPPGLIAACDFVTGGGFIIGSVAATDRDSDLDLGVKANFGVGGGMKNGAVWGHLEYNDHGLQPTQVHGTSVTAYGVPNPTPDANLRIIEGTADMNGASGFTYRVQVVDRADPGGGIDQFSLDVFDEATGDLVYKAGFAHGDGTLEGGNIQLHKANPSTTCP